MHLKYFYSCDIKMWKQKRTNDIVLNALSPLLTVSFVLCCILWCDLVMPGQVARAAPGHVEVNCGRLLLCLPAASTVWKGGWVQHGLTNIKMGPGSPLIIAIWCSAVEIPYKWMGITPSGWLLRPHCGLEITCTEKHGQIKISNWCLEETDLSCINVFYLSYFPTVFPAWRLSDCQYFL